MKTVELGTQGLKVSAEGLGCMGTSTTYGPSNDEASLATLHRAVELGITYFDTAEVYGPFHNEELLGRAFTGIRERVVISTKVGFGYTEDGQLAIVDGAPVVCWRAPVTVICCIPLAYIGSVVGMLVCGLEWNLASLVGLLMLSGIVVTNGIMLVDKIERNLAHGVTPMEAIMEGTLSRVRPVFMAAVTTVLTLLPLCVLGSGDAIISQSLGIVVVCGMISSTLISLLVIPLLYHAILTRNRAVQSTVTAINLVERY